MWRTHLGLTLQEVAKKLNVATSSVHKWEAGRAPVNMETLQRLAELFETEPAALLFPPHEQADLEKLRAVFRIATLGDPMLVQPWIELGNQFVREGDGKIAPRDNPANTLPPTRRRVRR
jgi:transcriptional regulator with XRE-family HTH domain